MLFNTDDLNIDYNTRNTLNLLESMYRIDRIWAKHTPASIPLMESKEYGAFIARYSDLMKLSEEYDASIQECLDAVIYENHLRPNEVIVSLEEWRPYVDPLILHRFSNNYVLVPEINTPAYRLCEVCMESFLETGDYTWLDLYVNITEEEAIILDKQANLLLEMPQDQWDYVASQSGLTDDQKKQIGAMWTGDQRVDDEELQIAIDRMKNQSYKNIKVDPKKAKEAEDRRKIQAEQERKERVAERLAAKKADPTRSRTAKRLLALRNQNQQLRSEINKNQNNDQSQTWLSKKWAALKNWWNNAGQADSNGNTGFFSNLAGKFKNFIGWGNNNQNNNTTDTNQVNNQAAQPAETAQDQTNKAAEDAAKKAEAEKKQAEKTEQQQAEKAAEQVKNNKKQEENKTAPATAPATPTDNKPAAPAATS